MVDLQQSKQTRCAPHGDGSPITSARVRIDTAAYEANIRYLVAFAGENTQVCAVLKADAYGHGIDLLAPAAARAGAKRIGFADHREAVIVRTLGITLPLLRLRPAHRDEVDAGIALGVEEMVGAIDDAQMISQLAQKHQCAIPIHLDLDVGMGRTGLSAARMQAHVRTIAALPGLRVVGIMTHFPVADDHPTRTQQQLAVYHGLIQQLQHDAIMQQTPRPLLHAANSVAALTMPESRLHMIRVGIASYGIAPNNEFDLPAALQPVMAWHTHVVSIRDVPAGATIGYGMTYTAPSPRRIATLPVGYADGYWRGLARSPMTYVLIGGKQCPMVGRVSMNMVTVDVTHVPGVALGDDVVLLGAQGTARIRAEDVAHWADTIGYEIACTIGAAAQHRSAV